MKSVLLEEGDLELVEALRLRARRRMAGFAAGEQRSPVLGGGIEFADWREYRPGDDVRLLDWSVWLRSRKLLVKLCAEEKELTLMTIIDASRSMDYGSPPKIRLAKRVACVLSGIALRGGNRAGIAVLGPRLLEPLRPERGRVSLPDVARVLASIGPVARPAPVEGLRRFAARYGRKCVAVLVSDLLFEEGEAALDALAASGCEAHVVQVLAPEELEPPERGEATLVDMEDGSEAPVHADTALLARYSDRLSSFLAATASACAARGLGHHLVASDAGLGRLFLEGFRKGGLLC